AKRFSKVARWHLAQKAEAARDQERRKRPRDLHESAITHGRQPNTPSKHAGEAAEAGKSDSHARLGDPGPLSEQLLGACDTRTTAQLVRRHAIQRAELADEVIRRQAHDFRHGAYGP